MPAGYVRGVSRPEEGEIFFLLSVWRYLTNIVWVLISISRTWPEDLRSNFCTSVKKIENRLGRTYNYEVVNEFQEQLTQLKIFMITQKLNTWIERKPVSILSRARIWLDNGISDIQIFKFWTSWRWTCFFHVVISYPFQVWRKIIKIWWFLIPLWEPRSNTKFDRAFQMNVKIIWISMKCYCAC